MAILKESNILLNQEFTSKYDAIRVAGQLLVDNGVIKDTVDMTVYVANRLATKNEIVKILGRGELTAKLKVTAHKFTATAKAAIEAAGGEAVTM